MRLKFKLWMVILIFLVASTEVFATGINIYFLDNAIKDRAGSTLPDANYHPYQARLEFFRSLPAPTVSTGKLSVDTQSEYTHVGGQHKYQKSSLDGGTLYVRVWKDALSGNRKGNYYGKSSHAVASGTTLPYDWFLTLQTSYKADVPYAPTISSIQEALIRVGNSLEATLTINIGYDQTGGTGGDGIREITGRSLKITYPDGTTETKNGSSVKITDAPQGTYTFQPVATNWYGSTSGTSQNYTTLGLGVGTLSFTHDLFGARDDLLIVNTIAIPSTNLSKPAAASGVSTATKLAQVINSAAGSGKYIVRAVCYWDPATGTAQSELFDATGNLVSPPDTLTIKPGVGYQVYTTEDLKGIVFEGQ